MIRRILPVSYTDKHQEKPAIDPALQALLQRHFWCDFSDMIASMKWDETDKPN